MGWNSAYWNGKEQRAAKAKKHHEEMMLSHKENIRNSVNSTEVITNVKPARSTGSPTIVVDNLDTVSALFKYKTDKIVVLNFASYKNPGGGFLSGSGAQEEALCHESDLYEILSDDKLKHYYEENKKSLNRALYTNKALLTPNVLFKRGENIITADVLTVAAPNRKAYIDYIKGANEEENLKALSSRIKFVADIIKNHGYKTAILGAFGCGVFAQDPKIVSALFAENFKDFNIKTIYAVIDKGGHSKEGAYAIFKNTFAEYEQEIEEFDR